VERFVSCQERRDPEALAQCYTLDGTAESPMYGTLVGRKAIADAYRSFFTSFPDLHVEVESMLIEPPRLAIFATSTATHVNDFFGLPGTGRRIDFRSARLLEMEGDLIKHERRIYDFTGVLVQTGVLRAKPGKV